MKKILAALLVLAIVAPAMADVAITATDNGTQQLKISFTASGGAVVRGIALKLTVTGGQLASYVASSSAFNTFVDQAFTTGGGYTIGSGTPMANPTAAGVATLPAAEASVSVGFLDTAGAQAGLTSGTVATIQLSGIADNTSATVAIVADALRGGAVVGDNLGVVTVQTPITIAGPVVVTECVKTTAPFYADWVAFGKPACWCYSRNCRGDINGTGVGTGLAKKWVTGTDLTAFKAAYNIANSLLPVGGVCADNNHVGTPATYGPTQKRVTGTDLTQFKLYYNQAESGPVTPVTICPDTNYNFWTN